MYWCLSSSIVDMHTARTCMSVFYHLCYPQAESRLGAKGINALELSIFRAEDFSFPQCRLAHVTSMTGDNSSQMPSVPLALEAEVSQHMSTVTQPLQCWSSAWGLA